MSLMAFRNQLGVVRRMIVQAGGNCTQGPWLAAALFGIDPETGPSEISAVDWRFD
jgi:hypothetical protein